LSSSSTAAIGCAGSISSAGVATGSTSSAPTGIASIWNRTITHIDRKRAAAGERTCCSHGAATYSIGSYECTTDRHTIY